MDSGEWNYFKGVEAGLLEETEVGTNQKEGAESGSGWSHKAWKLNKDGREARRQGIKELQDWEGTMWLQTSLTHEWQYRFLR